MNAQALVAEFKNTRDPRVLQVLIPDFQPRRHEKERCCSLRETCGSTCSLWKRAFCGCTTFGRCRPEFQQHLDPGGNRPPAPHLGDGIPACALLAFLPWNLPGVWQVPIQQLRGVLQGHNLWEPLCNELLGTLLDRKLQREAELLTLDGTARYLRLCEREPEWVKRIPIMHLASHLGLTDVSLSRIRRTVKTRTS